MEKYLPNDYYICYMKLTRLIVLFIPLMLITGCDALQKVDGIVMDKDTHEPIKNVSVGQSNPDGSGTEYYSSDIHHTDSTGNFHYDNIGGTGYFSLYYYKTGYQTIKHNYRGVTKPDTICMVRDGK